MNFACGKIPKSGHDVRWRQNPIPTHQLNVQGSTPKGRSGHNFPASREDPTETKTGGGERESTEKLQGRQELQGESVREN